MTIDSGTMASKKTEEKDLKESQGKLNVLEVPEIPLKPLSVISDSR